jgi:hypothetical protein
LGEGKPARSLCPAPPARERLRYDEGFPPGGICVLPNLLATGGSLLARFANDVVLTFNGPELYNEGFQAAPHYQIPPYARPAYGELPCGPCYSRKVKRMLDVPTGSSVICKEQQNQPQGLAPAP